MFFSEDMYGYQIDWLFVVFRPVENISLILRRHHCRWRAANLDLCLALMAFSSEGSLACHTCCDTGHPFLRSSPRTRDIHTYCRAFGSGTVTTCVNDLGLSRPGFEHPTFRMRGERSTDWATVVIEGINCKVMQNWNFSINQSFLHKI